MMSRRQFTLAHVFGVVWAVAVLCGTLRVGVLAVVLFGVPVAMLGLLLPGAVRRRAGSESEARDRVVVLQHCVGSVCVGGALILGLLNRFGMPVDLATWLYLLGTLAWSACLVVLLGPGPGLYWAYVPCIALVIALSARFATPQADLASGRCAYAVLGCLRFQSWRAPNVDLIESYLGERSAQWFTTADPYAARDGDNRIDKRSPIFDYGLPEMLAKLPSDEARRQVLTCLTDRENLIRAHQGLLLTCLLELDYPPGHDATTWWEHHARYFRPTRDPLEAVHLVYNWIEESKKCAPPRLNGVYVDRFREIDKRRDAAERSEYCGGFYPGYLHTYRQLMAKKSAAAQSTPTDDGPKEVVWWPRYVPEPSELAE